MSSGLLEARRDRVVEQAIEAGKIPPERREHYRRAWNENPVATEALLAELAPGLAPKRDDEGGLPRAWFASLTQDDARKSPPPSPPAAQAETEGLPFVPRSKPARRGRVTFDE